MSGTNRIETIRFARPNQKPPTVKPPRHTGILQDQLHRASRGPWCPSLSAAFRIILLVRMAGAMYSNISDCDEVFNFWEPLHYLDQNSGFQTWEVSPAYAIRSWAYISLHLLPVRIARYLTTDKRAAFFSVRITYAIASAFCEAKFYRTVAENINNHVGRYLLLFMLFSTGMWSATTAFLPSTFAMHANMLAWSYAFDLPSRLNDQRTMLACIFFALGALVGWPFSAALAIPFVLEEMLVYGKDRIKTEVYGTWLAQRWTRIIQSTIWASALLIPVIGVDTAAYGKLAVVPWNIVKYNIFSGESSRGPDLYGTEAWYFYILNLVLNFNVVLPLALIALPALAVTYTIDRRRLGNASPGPDESSPFTLLAIRLAPMYLWLAIFTIQPHKEERFMFPIYPLICFNGAVSVYLIRGWAEVAFIKVTKSPYQASRSSIFGNISLCIIILASLISASRIFALNHYYHAPMDIAFHLQYKELPRLLNTTNLIVERVRPKDERPSSSKYDKEETIDLAPLKVFGGLRLCLGKEWHRFPSSYLIPDGVNVEFIKSDFDGLLPGHFVPSQGTSNTMWWNREKTREIPLAMNDLNQEEPSRYVPVDTCDYLIDVDFPLRPHTSTHEPRYIQDLSTWDRVTCSNFLDAENSGRISRLIWLPGPIWEKRGAYHIDHGNHFGDYCLLRHRKRAHARETKKWSLPAS